MRSCTYQRRDGVKTRLLVLATFVIGVCVLLDVSAQPIPVSYGVRLASATVYDTRLRDEDTVHASQIGRAHV